MYNESYWIGKEVEGRYKDIYTIFFRKDYKKELIAEYPHVYFTIEFINDCIKKQDFKCIEDIIHTTKKTITIEANRECLNDIPLSIFNHVHIIYRIKDINIERLKQTDTVSVDADWYRVYQVTKMQMIKTYPDDYKYDLKI
jgi:hypothetical protein